MTVLIAEATIPTAAGSAYVAAVCERLLKAEFAASADSDSGRIELRDGLGIGTLKALSGRLRMKAEARTEQGLSILKFVLSMYVEEVVAADKPAQRVYTIRRIDATAAEMDIDFVMHELPGIASGWAARAKAGTIVGLLGPGGREMTPNDWVLLAGEKSAA